MKDRSAFSFHLPILAAVVLVWPAFAAWQSGVRSTNAFAPDAPRGEEPPFGGEPTPEEVALLKRVSERGTFTGLVLRGREPAGPGWAFMRDEQYGRLPDDLWEPSEGVRTAPIDARGCFRFQGCEPSCCVRIAVRFDDGTERRARGWLGPEASTRRAVFVLYTAGIEGRAFDGRGVPLAGVGLSLSTIGPGSVGTSFQTTTLTDSAGGFRFHGLTSGRYRLGLRRAGDVIGHESISVEVELEPGELRTVDFGRSAGLARLSGRLFAADGTPRPGWRILLATRVEDGLLTWPTIDERGHFKEALAPGEWQLALPTFAGELSTLLSFVMGEQDLDLDVQTPGVLVTGRIDSPGTRTGTSLDPEIMLCLREEGRYRMSVLRPLPDGRFEFHGVSPGRYVLQIHPARLLPGVEIELGEEEKRREVELVLRDP